MCVHDFDDYGEFITLAQHLNIQLVTQDKKVLRESPSVAIPVVDFIAQKT